MSFQSRLKERREYLNISRAEMAKYLNVTVGAISNYENGVSSPKVDLLFKIFEILECDANYLYQDSFETKDFNCSLDEQEHIKKYRSLDDYGKKAVDSTLALEYARVHDNGGTHFTEFEAAFNYLTSVPTFAMGGYDIDKMDKDELIDFANDMYEMDQRALKLFK